MPGSLGHAYVQGRLAQGKTKREAVRALKRLLARKVFRSIQVDLASGRTRLALT